MLPVFIFLYLHADFNLTLIEKLVNGICLCICFLCEFPVPLLFIKPIGFLSLLAWQIFHCTKVNMLEDTIFKFICLLKYLYCRKKTSYKIFFQGM